jgi:hypothetical protein
VDGNLYFAITLLLQLSFFLAATGIIKEEDWSGVGSWETSGSI